MKNIRNQFSCFWILSVCSIVFLFSSCASKASMTVIEESAFENKTIINLSDNQTDENEKIVETVKSFWKLSSEGDKENLPTYMREAPEEFWQSCSSTDNLNVIRNFDETNSDESFPKGEGQGVPVFDSKYEFLSLKNFSQQIKEKNVELVNARVIRATDNEAVVKIDWRQFNSGEGWISDYMLLYKDDIGWKVFMTTNPPTLTEYNKSFGYKDKCS